MGKLSKQEGLTPLQKEFAEEFEALKKEFKKAGTPLKKLLRDEEAPFHDQNDVLDDIQTLKDVYDQLNDSLDDGVKPLVTVTEQAVQALKDVRTSDLYAYYVEEEREEEEDEEESEDEEEDLPFR